MGKGFKKALNRGSGHRTKRKRDGEDADPSKRHAPPRPTEHSQSLTLENASLEGYYRGTPMVPESEWDAFISAMKRPLPTTFRFQLADAEAQRDIFISKWVDSKTLDGIEVGHEGDEKTVVEKPREIPWYPGRLAWRFSISKTFLRRDPVLKKFQKFLVDASANGDISRQEEVSMIPVCFLDPKPGEKVIDLCAAPGSKTSQIIDATTTLNKGKDSSEGHFGSSGTGLIIANDADRKRCHILTHQTLRRCLSPELIVTNNGAQRFPRIMVAKGGGVLTPGTPFENREKLLFDKVLADVPCSGDGTFRKNIALWKNWTPSAAIGLHRLQLQIAERAVQLARPGGRVVYSTCSLNPIENEAVVAHILRVYGDCVKLADVSQKIPELKRRAGIDEWVFRDKQLQTYESFDDVPVPQRSSYPRSMFPPTEAEAAEFALERCVRVLPQDQDTGGFFVAVFEKTADTEPKQDAAAAAQVGEGDAAKKDDESAKADNEEKGEEKEEDEEESKLPKMRKNTPHFDEKSFRVLDEKDPAIVAACDYYGIDGLPRTQFLTRGEKTRKTVFVSKTVRDVLSADDKEKLNVINTGVYVFKIPTGSIGGKPEDKEPKPTEEDPFAGAVIRLPGECLPFMQNYVTKRNITGTREDFYKFVSEEEIKLTTMEPAMKELHAALATNGPCIITFPDFSLPGCKDTAVLPLWRGSTSFVLQLAKTSLAHLRSQLAIEAKPVPKKDVKEKADDANKNEKKE